MRAMAKRSRWPQMPSYSIWYSMGKARSATVSSYATRLLPEWTSRLGACTLVLQQAAEHQACRCSSTARALSIVRAAYVDQLQSPRLAGMAAPDKGVLNRQR